MRGLEQHERLLLEYVAGRVTFGEVEQVIREQVRTYGARRAQRWTQCPALADDIGQVLLLKLWQLLDEYDPAQHGPVHAFCGARMEYAMRAYLRGVRRDRELVYEVVEQELSEDAVYGMIDLGLALRTITDEGVVAMAMAAIDAGSDVVSRLAGDSELMERLGWSDASRASNAARRRAQRNATLIQAITGGV